MQYDLVFEGGGAKGAAFVGAYEEFVRRGHSHNRLLGTSAGAITATLIAAGYTAQELLEAISEREQGIPVFAGFMGQPAPLTKEEIQQSAIRNLLDQLDLRLMPERMADWLDDQLAQALARNPSSRHLFAFIEQGGWYTADAFVTWLQAHLDRGSRQFSQMSLAQFFAATQVDLSVVASDTTAGRLLVLNHNTAPQCPLVWAVRMSMSIPLLWNEVVWQADWGSYLGYELTGHVIVDGGLLSNFPLELFISDMPDVTRLMGPKQATPVLGLLIDERLPVAPPTPLPEPAAHDTRREQRTLRRLKHLVDTATGAHDKMVLEAFSDLVVHLPAQGYGTAEFDMSDERRGALVAAARHAMGSYFDTHPTAVAQPHAANERVPTRAVQLAHRMAQRLLG